MTRLEPVLTQLVGADRAQRFAAPLTAAAAPASIDTPLRLAHFLAQALHETAGLRYLAELWGPTPTQAGYDIRTDLGNTPQQDGDGRLYRGRGLLMLTGHANYAAYAQAVGEPQLLESPELLEQPRDACLSATWYWHAHHLNELADRDDLLAVTKTINGGTNGLQSRRQWLQAAKAALPTAQPPNHPTPEPLGSFRPLVLHHLGEPEIRELLLAMLQGQDTIALDIPIAASSTPHGSSQKLDIRKETTA